MLQVPVALPPLVVLQKNPRHFGYSSGAIAFNDLSLPRDIVWFLTGTLLESDHDGCDATI